RRVVFRLRLLRDQRKAATSRRTPYYSSSSFNFASTAKSSSVVTSPFTSPLVASSRSKRRMILPLLVFGSASLKRRSSGFASAPISFATQRRNSSFNSSDGSLPISSV